MCAALIPGLRPLDGSCRILRSPVSRFTGFRGYRALNASTVPTTDELRARYRNMEINRIFILEKITKYDLEIRNGLSDYEICNRFPLAYRTHLTHLNLMESLLRLLKEKYGIHTIVVKAQSHNLSVIDIQRSAFPPDLIISAGGDGTFLEAASLIPPTQVGGKQLWIVGINTDPERSKGMLCLSYFKNGNSALRSTIRQTGESIAAHKAGNYEIPKQRMIRFSQSRDGITKECASDNAGEKEWSDISGASFCGMNSTPDAVSKDHCTVISQLTTSIYNLTYDEYIGNLLDRLLVKRECEPICRQKIRIKIFKRNRAQYNKDTCDQDSANLEQDLFCRTESNFNGDELNSEVFTNGASTVPHGAVNDIIIADNSFEKTFYALVQVDDSPIMRVKCSGVLVTTGTGSTAWAYNMCKVSMDKGLRLYKHLLDHPAFPKNAAEKVDEHIMQEAIESHNSNLTFAASDSMLKCIIREGINDASTVDTSSFNGRQVKVLSLSKNSQLFIDGSKTLKVDYGDVVVLKTFDSDIIWSCV